MMAYLSCNIAPGQLGGEWAVRGTVYGGVEFSLFAPQDVVKPVGESIGEADQERPGLLCVQVLEEDGARALVALPAPTFENGQIITVDLGQIQRAG